MFKLTFIGAGSTVFAKNVLGDCLLTPTLGAYEICLFDIDEQRLEDSFLMVSTLAKNLGSTNKVTKTMNRREALSGAKYVVNAIQVGGYEPCTVTDFEIPKKYGLHQTIGDTLGIGGIFRALRTIPVLEEIAREMEELCPDALFINYTNPMAILTGYMQRYTKIKTVGLCHSVQHGASGLLKSVGLDEYAHNCKWEIAGINHQAWLLSLTDLDGNDLYPQVKKRSCTAQYPCSGDLVRHDLMHRFGYYITESSEHNSEYTPWYIKHRYPELIKQYNIPLDEYPRRCVNQIAQWGDMREKLLSDPHLTHEKTFEFASFIIDAMENDRPFRIHGNVINNGVIPNLPKEACVEVPCMVDRNGINPCYVGKLPLQCACVNMTNISPQLLTIQAAVTREKKYIYMAAMLDPHTGAELSPEDIFALCDELIVAHGDWLPAYK